MKEPLCVIAAFVGGLWFGLGYPAAWSPGGLLLAFWLVMVTLAKWLESLLPSPEATGAQTWHPIETAPNDDTVILRPHRIWGAMDVQRVTDNTRHQLGTLSKGIDWRWLNGDLTTAWTEEAFLPFWMPRPAQPIPAPAPSAERS